MDKTENTKEDMTEKRSKGGEMREERFKNKGLVKSFKSNREN